MAKFNKKLTEALPRFLHQRMKTAGMSPDVHDADFIVSTIQDFLQQNDSALTGSGVRRFKRES